jgi:hypothetical protein
VVLAAMPVKIPRARRRCHPKTARVRVRVQER